MFGMRPGAHSPKRWGYGLCLLSVVCGSCCRHEICPLEKQEGKIGGSVPCLSVFSLGIVFAMLWAKCQCLIATFVKTSPELDLLVLKLISAEE